MKRFSTGLIPFHSVAIGAQPDDDGPLCLYFDHLAEVREAVERAGMDAERVEQERCARIADDHSCGEVAAAIRYVPTQSSG